jgi:hypothetical protein
MDAQLFTINQTPVLPGHIAPVVQACTDSDAEVKIVEDFVDYCQNNKDECNEMFGLFLRTNQEFSIVKTTMKMMYLKDLRRVAKPLYLMIF